MDYIIGVSVCLFSYNYEKYISVCIESVLKQKTNFPIEIVIGDDCSTDNTRKIALEYYNKFPQFIRLSFNENNVGGTNNWVKTINKCKGKYISLVDGDDYFTDEYKLQKQFNALETDSNAVLCFHAVEEKYDDLIDYDKVICFDKPVYTIEDFLQKGWFIRTSSTFFKNGILPLCPPKWVHDYPYRYDTIIHVFLTQYGHAIYLNENMSVWRKHSNGMSRVLAKNVVGNIQKEISLAKQLSRHTDNNYINLVDRFCSSLYSKLFLNLLSSGLAIKYPKLFFKSFSLMNCRETIQYIKLKILK